MNDLQERLSKLSEADQYRVEMRAGGLPASRNWPYAIGDTEAALHYALNEFDLGENPIAPLPTKSKEASE